MKERYTKKDFSRIRGWILLRRLPDGTIEGYVENSFSMSWSKTHVRVMRYNAYGLGKNFKLHDYRVGQAKTPIYYHEHTRKDLNVFVCRIGSKKCPVKINWWYYYHYGRRCKYEWRNLKFTVK